MSHPPIAFPAMSDLLDLHDDSTARRVLYVAAFLLIVVPFIQAGSQLWPLQLRNIQWRFGAANALSAVLLLPFLGLTLLLLMSRLLESRAVAITVGVVAGIFTAGLSASFVLFVLDALQLKTIVSTQMEGAFKSTSARVGLVTVLFTFAFLVLALAGFKKPRGAAVRSGRRSAERDAGGDEDVAPGLIVGR